MKNFFILLWDCCDIEVSEGDVIVMPSNGNGAHMLTNNSNETAFLPWCSYSRFAGSSLYNGRR